MDVIGQRWKCQHLNDIRLIDRLVYITVNPCTNNLCKNGGTCTVTGDDSYSCQCAEGFYGDTCEKGMR